MKRIAITISCALGALGAFAQGTVTFMNHGGEVNAPIYDVDGTTPLAGPAFLARLYAAASGSSLAPVGMPVPFQTEGYFDGGDVGVLGVNALSTAVVQVRVWRAADGATFEEANRPGGHIGISGLLTVGPLGDLDGGVPVPGALLTGLQSFSLYVVPEPSVLALGLFGGLAFAIGWAWLRL